MKASAIFGSFRARTAFAKADNALDRVVLGAYLTPGELSSSSSLAMSIGVTGVRGHVGMTSTTRPQAQFGECEGHLLVSLIGSAPGGIGYNFSMINDTYSSTKAFEPSRASRDGEGGNPLLGNHGGQ